MKGLLGARQAANPLKWTTLWPAEFLLYIEAAGWTGAGRQAVWGKGEIAVLL